MENGGKVLNVNFERSHKHGHIIHIKRCAQDDTTTPKLVKKTNPCGFLKALSDRVNGRTKSSSDSGSPCLSPLPCTISVPAIPLRSTREVAVANKAATQFRNRGGGGTFPLHEVQNVFPPNRVKRLTNVKLEEKSRDLCFVEPRGKVLDIQEIVVNTPLLDEGALSIGDKLIHVRGETKRKHLCNNFGNSMYETNRPEIGDVLRTLFLGK
jgi:hypothetical protein